MAAAMPAVANSCRLSAAVTSRNLRRKLASRGFSSNAPRYAASNYLMPAMSPTMSEGNISAWKVKEGDSFSAGDVLLEIETDKAQMDVEAQEDGMLAKIVQGDGSKGIKVGARIAVMAEEGDDLSSLEMPADEPAKPQAAQEEQKPEASPQSEPKESEPAAAPSKDASARKQPGGKPQEQKYPLYPSVSHLLHTNNIPLSDASKIPATGPAGRLLKGDVLSYLNAIPPNYSAEQSARVEKLSHLDLSNVKAHVPPPPKPKPKPAPEAAAPAPPTQIAVPVSLAAVLETQSRLRAALGLDLPLSTFVARASEIANEGLPRARAPPSADDLFDAVLGLPAARDSTSRGHYVPQITALAPAGVPVGPRRPAREPDVMDVLTGAAPKRGGERAPARGAAGVVSAEGRNVFSVAARPGEEARARTYLERVKSVLEAEPGRCVL